TRLQLQVASCLLKVYETVEAACAHTMSLSHLKHLLFEQYEDHHVESAVVTAPLQIEPHDQAENGNMKKSTTTTPSTTAARRPAPKNFYYRSRRIRPQLVLDKEARLEEFENFLSTKIFSRSRTPGFLEKEEIMALFRFLTIADLPDKECRASDCTAEEVQLAPGTCVVMTKPIYFAENNKDDGSVTQTSPSSWSRKVEPLTGSFCFECVCETDLLLGRGGVVREKDNDASAGMKGKGDERNQVHHKTHQLFLHSVTRISEVYRVVHSSKENEDSGLLIPQLTTGKIKIDSIRLTKHLSLQKDGEQQPGAAFFYQEQENIAFLQEGDIVTALSGEFLLRSREVVAEATEESSVPAVVPEGGTIGIPNGAGAGDPEGARVGKGTA
ncbi:unnamed protein product, partial [Amoebophrya sp. A120]